jgi:hypothetical protein
MALAFAWVATRRPSVRGAKPVFGDWFLVVPPLFGDAAGIRTDVSAPLSEWKIKGSFTTAEACEQTVKRNKSSVGGEPVYGRLYGDRNAAGRAQIFAARCVRRGRPRIR